MMPSGSISNTVLAEIGWDEGMTIPVANAENKILEDELLNNQQQISALRNELSEHEDRVNTLCEHLKNVRQELHLIQALHVSRKKEQDTEDHMTKLAEREEGRLRQEVDKMQKELNELKDRENVYENNKFRLMQRLEEMKAQMNWDQQALQAWLEESARKDEDAMIIAKYSRQDELKVKELSGKIGHMVNETQKKKRHLDQEHTETQMVQLELDKTAEEFRKAHTDRQELLSQWQQTIDQMQKRDNEMDLLALQLGKLRAETRNKENQVKEKDQFYESEISNNREFDKKISAAERMLTKLKQEYQDTEHQRDIFNSDLEVLKRTVDRTASDLESTRAEVKHGKKEVIVKQEKMAAVKKVVEEVKVKLQKTVDTKLSAEERSKRIETTLHEEERNQAALQLEIKQLSDVKFRRNNELFAMKTEIKNLDTEMQGMHAAMRNYNSKILELDQDSLKQMEIIYNQDFNIQSVERRIGRMHGERSSEETAELDTKIRELTQELDRKTATHNILTSQIKKLLDDLRKMKFSLERVHKKKVKVSEKIADVNLQLDNAQKENKRVVTNKQNLMVEENILKLEVKRKRDALYKTTDDVVTLEKSKMQMETAMKERQQEVKVHIDMINAQIRAADAERRTISAEVHERMARIDKLRKRFEILMIAMAPPEGEEEKSQAFYVIKAAQEKEELQREGDQLDANIRKAEKEIRALENTLRLMNSRNDTYRRSLTQVGESSDEMEQKQQLEEQLRAYNDKKRYKKRQIRELQEDLQVMKNTMDNLRHDEDAYNETILDKQSKIAVVQKETDEQQCRLDRAAKMNAKYIREARKKSKEETSDEIDFEVRMLRELTQQALKQVAETVQQYPDIGPSVQQYMSQASLPLPTTTAAGSSSSRASSSSTPASVRSSLACSGSMRSARSTSSHGSTGSRGSAASQKPIATSITIGTDFVVAGSARSTASSKSSSTRSSRASSCR